MDLTFQRLMIAIIVGLFPMLVYCLLLMGLNGRNRASMVPGTWDFAGVLLATSGFILGGGPLILAGLNSAWRRYLLQGRVSDWRTLSGEGNTVALGLWALFFVAVVCLATTLIMRRRSYTVIYNVDVPHFENALEWIFGRLALVWKRTERGYEINRPHGGPRLPWRQPLTTQADGSDSGAEPANRPETAWLVLYPLPGSCNVTLQWFGDSAEVRRRVEGEMQQLLPNLRPESNPVSQRLLVAATALFGVLVAAIVFVILTTVKLRGTIGTI